MTGMISYIHGGMTYKAGKPLISQETFERLWVLATRGFALGVESDHGPDHWQRVERNVLRIVERAGAGDRTVVRLFAVLHDSKRRSEFHDPEHGQRAADWAFEIRGELFELDDGRFEQLQYALIWHDKGRTSDDPTVGACWDGDRLDLPRVGIQPHPRFMSTAIARSLLSDPAEYRRWRTP